MPRSAKVLTTVGVLLALAAGTAYVTVGDRLVHTLAGTYVHELQRYDDAHGERNRFVPLRGGKAVLSLGSPDGHRLVVQWRDPDGHGWTEPQTVHREPRLRAVDSTVRVARGTVAIVETYTPDVHDDSDVDDVRVLVTCRDLECTQGRRAGGFAVSEPQVTPDGRTVLYGWDEEGALTWDREDGWATWPWDLGPLPRGVSMTEPLLAPDGSLRLVRGQPGDGACHYTLLASGPRSGELEEVARTSASLPRRARDSLCHAYLDTLDEDWVGVEPDDHATDHFWFIRRDGSWSVSDADPSGLVPGPDLPRDECCEAAVAGFVGGAEVSFFSPDGRRISVQPHFRGDETWAPRQLLPGAPAGARCTWMDGSQVGDRGFAVHLVCHSRPSPEDNMWRGDLYAFAVSRDLEEWETFVVRHAVSEPVIDEHRGLQVPGRPFTWWSLEDGLHRLDLPQPPGSAVGLTEDGTHVQLRLSDGRGGCRAEAFVAEPGASSWTGPLPGSYQPPRRAECRIDYVNPSVTDGVQFTLFAQRATRAAVVERVDGQWRLHADSDFG